MGERKINRTDTFNALKKSEERFRNIVETLSDWIWEVDENAVYRYSSPRVFDLLGYKPEEIIGRTPFDLMPPEEAARVSEIFGPIALEQRPFDNLKNTNLHKDGRLVVLETSGIPFYNKSGNFCGYRGVDRDITAREKINRQLKEKEAAFVTAQKIARIGDFERDIASGELYWSEELYRIFGFTPGKFQATFQAFLAVIHPDDLEFFKETIEEAINEKKTFDMDYRIILPDGSEKTVHVRGEAVFDDSGSAVKTRGTVQDITERKRSEDELRRLSSIIEQTDDFVATADENRQVLYYNRAARKILGLGSDEDLSGIHIPSTHTKWAWDLVLNEGIPTAIRDGIWTGETAFLNRNGEETPVLQTIIAHKSPKGDIPYLSTIARDISEIKKAEKIIRESEERFRAIVEATNDNVWETDSSLIVTKYTSPTIYEAIGVKPDDVVGKYILDIVAAEEKERIKAIVLPLVAERRPVRNLEIKAFHQKEQRYIWFEINCFPLFDPTGEFIGYRGVDRMITRQKELENELRERNLLLQTLIDSIPDMFYYKDLHGRYMIVNGAFVSFAGLSKEEVTGKAPEEFLPAETAKAVRESDEIILLTAAPLRFEYPTADSRGNKKVLDIIKTPVLNASDEVIGMLGVLRDITDKKEAEDTIKRSLDFYLELFDKLPQPLRRTDSYWRCNYVNRAWLKRTGQEFEEAISYGWTAALYKEDRETTMNEFMVAFKARQPAVLTYRILSRDGKYRWIIEYGTPFNGMDGEFAGYICSCHDFTERKKIEEALAQSENRFKQFFEQNEVAIMLLNPLDCVIRDTNPAAARLYGYTREELIAQGLALFISPLLLEGFKEVVRSSVLSEGAEGFSILPQFHTRKDGSSVIVVVQAKSIRLSPEETPVLYCSFFDITATIRLQEEGKVRQAQLIHSNKMASVGLMISGVVHEINNPNAFIMSNAQLMQDISQEVLQLLERLYKAQPDISLAGLSFPEIREAAPRLVSGIIDASTRINEIVRNIGDFVRPESGDMEKKIDINSAILTSTAILTNQIKKCTDNFHLDLNKGLPLIRGSSQKLEQVIINLVMNSLQALPDRGRGVYVSTDVDKEADCVIIEIRDEGRGMQEENMNRIKEPFFTTKGEAGGTGLGLFISDEIIRKHNGSLSFESEHGKGTRAIIRLPIDAEL